MNPKILEAIAVTCAITQTEMPEAAARVMCADLDSYPEAAVLAALVRCRRELTGRLTLAAVLERLDDGRPGPEEAWAASPRQEQQSVVWTEEWASAYFAALPHIEAGDLVAARMTFLEKYRRGLAEARATGVPSKWTLSPGFDPIARRGAVERAVERGSIGVDRAMRMLPELDQERLIALTASKAAQLEHRP